MLNKYKQKKINDLTNKYNSDIKILQIELSNTIKKINKLSINSKSKNIFIGRLISSYNQNLKNLKNIFNKNIQNINNYNSNFPTNLTNFSNKKSLLFGLNYINTQYQLNGCIEDTNRMADFLSTKGFTTYNILTDLTEIKPTKENILNKIKDFVNSSNKDDLLFIYFSGHGSSTYDNDGDELDGSDEMIISLDFQPVYDDEIQNILKNNKNVTIIGLFDSCHSGTMFDLKYSYDIPNNDYIENNNIGFKEIINGNILMISGCLDDQYSSEALINDKIQGAMTWTFINILTNYPDCSWFFLLENMNKLLNDNGYLQNPLLSTNNFYDINSKIFL